MRVKRVAQADQILPILERSEEPLVLIEHDTFLFDEHADLIRPIGQICRKRGSERRTTIMVATRSDSWVKRFEPFAQQMRYQEDLIQYLPNMRNEIRSPQGQRTLEGVM